MTTTPSIGTPPEHDAHGVDGRAVGAFLVAAAHPAGRRHGRGLGDPDQLHGQVAFGCLGTAVFSCTHAGDASDSPPGRPEPAGAPGRASGPDQPVWVPSGACDEHRSRTLRRRCRAASEGTLVRRRCEAAAVRPGHRGWERSRSSIGVGAAVLGPDRALARRGAQRQHRPPPAQPDPAALWPTTAPRRSTTCCCTSGWSCSGRSDFAVRALSGVISVATLPFFWVAGRRLGGGPVAWVTFFLALSSPVRHQLRHVGADVLADDPAGRCSGYLALSRALEDPTPGRLVAVGAGHRGPALHPLLGPVPGRWWPAPGWRWRIVADGRRAAGPAGHDRRSLLWLPWAPVFVFQTLHTGHALDLAGERRRPARASSATSPGADPGAALLMFATFALFLFGMFGRTAVPGTPSTPSDPTGTSDRSRPGRAVVLELRPRPAWRPLAGIASGTLGVAVVLGAVANAAFVARYTAVVLPLFLLVVATGVAVLPGRRVPGRLRGRAVPGRAADRVGRERPAAHPGRPGRRGAQRPGPARRRGGLLPRPARPGGRPPPPGAGRDRDHLPAGDRARSGSTGSTTRRSSPAPTSTRSPRRPWPELAPGHTLWLVWRDGYPGLGGDCGYLKSWLDLLRPTGSHRRCTRTAATTTSTRTWSATPRDRIAASSGRRGRGSAGSRRRG